MKRRLRAPSPALVIALIALFVALGGSSYAAINSLPKNSVGSKQLKKNAVTGVKIKNGAVTKSKINTSGLTVPNATHASTADSATTATSATNATNATNATTAANSNALGGVAASGYVKNAGTTFIQEGWTGWQPFFSTDPITVTRYTNAEGMAATTTGGFSFRIDPAIPASLYGHEMSLTGVQLCYGASTAATITDVWLQVSTFTTGSPGTTPTALQHDTTHRTDSACRTYSPASPVAVNSTQSFSIYLQANWTAAGSTLYLGRVTAILQPTSTVAAAPKAPATKTAPGVGGSAPR
jgi:hypothetical protein